MSVIKASHNRDEVSYFKKVKSHPNILGGFVIFYY